MEKFNKTNVVEELRMINDDPEVDNLYFHFSDYGDSIAKLLTAKTLPIPFCMGINGPWGSGKSYTIKKYTEKN